MALDFPALHDRIDWTRPYEFLDAELQRITGDSEIGRRYADRLVKVYSREETELWLLLHIEVQAQPDALLYRYRDGRDGRDDALKRLRFIDPLIRLPRRWSLRWVKN